MGANTELPTALEEATKRFRDFLQEQGWPTNIVWLQRDDVLPRSKGISIRARDYSEAFGRASQEYSAGKSKGLGVALIAHCADDQSTFASIFLPADDFEAQRALMGKGLKLSAFVDRIPFVLVQSQFMWIMLRIRNAMRATLERQAFQETLDTFFFGTSRR